MMNSQTVVESLSSSDLRNGTHELVRRSHGVEAQLLVYLGTADEDNRYRGCRCLGGLHERPGRMDHSNPAPDHLAHDPRHAIKLIFGKMEFDRGIAALDDSRFA